MNVVHNGLESILVENVCEEAVTSIQECVRGLKAVFDLW